MLSNVSQATAEPGGYQDQREDPELLHLHMIPLLRTLRLSPVIVRLFLPTVIA